MLGRTLSHYHIVDEISRGGMGVVYRAVDVNLGRDVALKVLPDDLVHDPVRRERLLQEARAASSLEHPHIAVIHEVGEADGVTFIAMELIRGEKMSQTLAHGPLPHARAFALATEIAEGLSRAHEKGIVHRDLKPANVMVTDDGHAKIIDFGLAKVVDAPVAEAATASIDGPRTDAGVVLGTAAYMSPEQARGERVDHRTDIFALGVTLYEMMTGRPAFQGRSVIDTMQAILTQPVPPLPSGVAPSIEAAAELQRIIGKCTAKDPDDRFQGMKDLIVDLRAARRRLESSAAVSVPAAAVAPARRMVGGRAVLLAGIVAATAIGIGAYLWSTRRQAASVKSTDKPAVAVLYFENNTGDKSLDWMRTGLTDMIVTDLSQSSDVEVIGTDRLVQILQEMNRVDDRVISADVVKEIATRAGVDQVLVGSYVKAGDVIRISARLQDAQSGRIMRAERVEGAGESALFSLVDELTRRFRSTMATLAGGAEGALLSKPGAAAPERGLDRGVTDITTGSIEAYRYYVEGLNFHERGLSQQAMPLLEKAIEVDPEFAMAHAKLAVVSGNLQLLAKRDEHAKKALALVNRLTSRERYYIEGYVYGLRFETQARSIEAYKQGLALHPEHQASRHNLALQLLLLERFEEAIAQYDELRRRGTSNPTTYEQLSGALIATGNVRRAREVVEEFLRRHPDIPVGPRMLGTLLIAEGRLDEARAAYERAHALNPSDFASRAGIRNVAFLQTRWADADSVSADLNMSSNPFQRLAGIAGSFVVAAGQGRGRAMLEALDRAVAIKDVVPEQRAIALLRKALALIRQGNSALALPSAEAALKAGANTNQEFDALRVLAMAQAGSGHESDAARTLGELESRAKVIPTVREARRVHWARGEVALLNGDVTTAAAELTKAVQMLPQHGAPNGPPAASPHGELWYIAAVALSRAGRDEEAAPLLERLQSGHERAFVMDAYARSFFLLGRIEERRGNTARARQQYARFVELWGDGDLEREWIAEARKKISR